MADKPPEGLGRGGRGALLLAALKNQPRRPGQAEGIEKSSETHVEPPALGRGAFLKALSQSRGRAIASPAVVEESELSRPVGRGRGLALIGLGRGLSKADAAEEKSTSSQVPIETVTPSPPSPSSLIPKIEDFSIGKYSGTSGSELKVEANYVRLKVLGNEGIYEYHVSFTPSVDSKRMKFRLMNQPPVKEITGNVKTFDGSKLYLPRKLPPVTDVSANLLTDASAVNISIKFIKRCEPSDCLHLYNLLFRKVMHILNMTQRHHAVQQKSGLLGRGGVLSRGQSVPRLTRTRGRRRRFHGHGWRTQARRWIQHR